jgi:hypothetical protein
MKTKIQAVFVLVDEADNKILLDDEEGNLIIFTSLSKATKAQQILEAHQEPLREGENKYTQSKPKPKTPKEHIRPPKATEL